MNERNLTLRYMAQQMAYWAAAAGVMSFATAYLLAKNFPASQVGVLLASGNLLSCLLQPVLAERADRIGGDILKKLVVGMSLMSALCFALLPLLPLPRLVFGLLYLMGVFFSRYRWYCASLLGVALLAMFHAMTENYLIETVKPLGGDSGSVGVALFIATLIEMPVLVWFDQVRRRIADTRLLKIAGISFLVKAVLFLLAGSVAEIYLLQLLQATSYAFLSPTQLYYANQRVAPADMVKGQACITASYALGCALGNFTGGQLLHFFSLRVMLSAGVVIAAAGTLILLLTVDHRDAWKC